MTKTSEVYWQTIDGTECAVHVVNSGAEATEFLAWLKGQKHIAVDSETSGLDIFSPAFEVYTVQFGNGREAWVLDAERWPDTICAALSVIPFMIFHNATFDLLVLDQHLGYALENSEGQVLDTRILAHLLDPRTESEGGTGHGLKRLSTIWVDPSAPDSEAALKDRFRELKATVSTGWAIIERNDPVLLRYAGVDTILTFRLFEVLRDLVNGANLNSLVDFEHRLQYVTNLMQRKGMLLDVDYTAKLRERLAAETEQFSAVAARYGVQSINSTAQVAEALTGMGEVLRETTPSGAPKVDKAVLLPLADLDRDWNRIGAREPNRLADAVLRAKRAEKWDTAYAQAFLDLRDDEDRLHPWINALQARTARMSVSRPPLQQLPSGDSLIRNAFLADPGQVIASIDYDQIEMRVIAALSGDQKMTEAILAGEDMHSFTARHVFGPDFTPRQRKVCKGIGFSRIYGGGAETTARQSGAGIEEVRNAMKAYDKTFIGLTRYSRSLIKRAEYGKKEVVTPSGRHLPLDRDRLYAAVNYVTQSTARDVLAQAVVNIYEEGLADYILLPIHDELLLSLPKDNALEIGNAIAEVMTTDFMGIPLTASPEIGGERWGSLYE